jgi:exonuclease III
VTRLGLPGDAADARCRSPMRPSYASGAPVVLAGDYNVVPTDPDIYPTRSWDHDALLQPESRAYQRLLSQGWTHAVRALRPKEPVYTFWDYMRGRWERDGGLRLDPFLLSPTAEPLQDAGVDRHVRGVEGARPCACLDKPSGRAKAPQLNCTTSSETSGFGGFTQGEDIDRPRRR